MSNLSRVVVALGVVSGFSLASAATLVGCSGDDGDPDADANIDNTSPDVVQIDTGSDVITTDSGDGGSSDAPYDTAALLAFPNTQLEATCNRFGQCCGFGDAGDAGNLDMTKCKTLVLAGGGIENNLSGLTPTVLSSNARLDETQAASCLAQLATLSCANMSSTEFKAIWQACYASVYGVIPQGGTNCAAAAQCAKGTYCLANSADAGDGGLTSSCLALVGDGGTCNQAGNNEACAYRGHVNQQLACEILSIDGGVGSGTCKPLRANGAFCNYSWECQSGACDDNYLCATAFPLVGPGLCGVIKQ